MTDVMRLELDEWDGMARQHAAAAAGAGAGSCLLFFTMTSAAVSVSLLEPAYVKTKIAVRAPQLLNLLLLHPPPSFTGLWCLLDIC